MKPIIALFMFSLLTSVSSADSSDSSQASNLHDILVAETETHSTAGISNKAAPQNYRDYPQQLPTDEIYPYYEEELINEELTPPTSVEQVSPTKSKTITRTTSRPTRNNPQTGGVDVAPVIVPVYPNAQGYPSPPPGVYMPPPISPRYPYNQ